MSAAPDKTRYFEGLAGTWDATLNQDEQGKRLRLAFGRLLAPESVRGRRVLDAGCGTGNFSQVLAGWGARLVSLDIGPSLAALARKKSGAPAVCADLMALPFPDGAFDLVFSTEAVEHTTEPRRAVDELARVVAPGGTLLLTTPNRLWRPAIVLATALGLRPYEGLENWVWPGDLERWLSEAGLKVEGRAGFNLLPHTVFCRPAFDWLDRLPGLRGLMINVWVRAVRPAPPRPGAA
ncbi:MAG: 2-polyprenyl-6-hydroxyphenyl methylase / 3-demethylubiquinone-9 3-methyltransferase [Elusimicrobia bacterium]|nr:MAG: 2-polyprenyl-6-hydroxyphenyl methylase / 3-demethylubiquinone-9 3-methyltransferase [Elusimicrobiota bacterium]